jgi:hypothetical protein
LIPLHHAVSYRHIVEGLEPVSKPELDATRHFLRPALEAARPFLGGESAVAPDGHNVEAVRHGPE